MLVVRDSEYGCDEGKWDEDQRSRPAKTPVMLALGEIEGKTGGFWQNERIIEW